MSLSLWFHSCCIFLAYSVDDLFSGSYSALYIFTLALNHHVCCRCTVLWVGLLKSTFCPIVTLVTSSQWNVVVYNVGPPWLFEFWQFQMCDCVLPQEALGISQCKACCSCTVQSVFWEFVSCVYYVLVHLSVLRRTCHVISVVSAAPISAWVPSGKC